MADDIGKYKTKEHINYINVDEGIFKGVAYKVNNTKFEERDGKKYLKFDYDVKGLTEGMEQEFEQYLGEFLIRALKWSIDNDIKNDGNQI